MRPYLAVLAVLAMTWPQQAMTCDSVATSHGTHASAAAQEDAHGDPSCAVLLRCATVMIESVTRLAIAPAHPPAPSHRQASTVAPETSTPGTDPPPPRRAA